MRQRRFRSQDTFRAVAMAGALALASWAVQASDAEQAAARRPLTIEDYYRVQTVGSPSVSPNGKWVVFTVSTRVEDDNSTKTETHLVAADGSGKPWRVMNEGKDVTNARWSPENWLVHAVADGRGGGGRGGRGGGGGGRGGGGENARPLWKIDPERPADPPVRADAPPDGLASPDGKWLAVAVDQPRPKNDPASASDFEKRHQSADRFKGVIFDWKDFQRDGAPFPAPNQRANPAAHIQIKASAGGEPTSLTDLDVRPTSLAWHPNGTLLAFIADTHWRNELLYERPDLWTVTTAGKVTRLTDDLHTYSDVEFSPDGKYLSYSRGFGTDMVIQQKLNHGGPRDLFLRRTTGGEPGEPINLTASWDLEAAGTQWTPDSKFIYFTAGIGGESHVFRVSVPAGQVEQITKGPRRLGGVSFDRMLTKMTYTVGLHDRPSEVYVANIDGTNERKLTSIHDPITTTIAFNDAERLRWPSYDGTPIEGWLMPPVNYDPQRRYPLIVFSHGGPHAATGYSFDFKKQYFAANGYFVLDTNFRSSTGYGEAFKWATWGEWGKKDGEDVMSGIDYVQKRFPIDPKRVGHTGHSYGGFMTNWLITQYPDRFAAAITGAGISNWISDYGTADIYRTKETEFFGTPWEPAARDRMIKQSPLTYAGQVKTPTLFVHGEVDQRVPYEEAEQMYFALKRRGVPAKMIQYAGQPHGIGGHWNNVHRMLNELAWWERYLKGTPPAATSQGQRAEGKGQR